MHSGNHRFSAPKSRLCRAANDVADRRQVDAYLALLTPCLSLSIRGLPIKMSTV
jgi:hypothetical protein